MERDIDHLIKLASKNIDQGVIEEPRYYFDILTLLSGGQITKDDPQVFLNGEEFPVRITEIGFALRPDFDNEVGLEERLLQRIGARFVFHDQYYQSRQFAPIPLWATKVTTGPVGLTDAFIHETFDRPVILSARDSLQVTVALETAPDGGSSRRASVGFHGVGLQSKRPYFFQSYRDLVDTTPIVLPTADFRNDGAEPVGLTDVVVSLGAAPDDLAGTGDIRNLRVQIRQLGNGTGRGWVVYPTIQSTATALPQIPAQLLGFTQGRSVVHQLPGQGMIFEPGEGIIAEALALDNLAEGVSLGICLRGYISLV